VAFFKLKLQLCET